MTLYDCKTKGATDAFISRRREASLGLEISMDLITFIVAPVPFHLGLTFGEIEQKFDGLHLTFTKILELCSIYIIYMIYPLPRTINLGYFQMIFALAALPI